MPQWYSVPLCVIKWSRAVRQIILFLILILLIRPTLAQSNTNRAILYVWEDQLFAQGITQSDQIATGRTYTAADPLPPLASSNVYRYADSPLRESPLENYGFDQGPWSADEQVFVFLALQADGPGYQVIQVIDGVQQVLLAATVTPERGYLQPLGWANDGALILLERYALHNLAEVRLWVYAADGSLTLRDVLPVPDLKGNSALLEGGWAFVGFDTVAALGYLVNLNGGQIATFATTFTLPNPPDSVFEIYPLQVLGVVDLALFQNWLDDNPPSSTRATPLPLSTPFLYWPLPDDRRQITCYPDSSWTDLRFPVECIGMAPANEYPGHQGTDVSGPANGLPLGTPVYAAAHGMVVLRFIGCQAYDVSCGDAYGNHVLLEHSRVVDDDIQTWFTGYAHLQAVLVEPNTYINDLGVPIALSGATGVGGPHLHFEVRSPQHPTAVNWLDPWDPRQTTGESGLWIGTPDRPNVVPQLTADVMTAQFICLTGTGNNIRSGPGTDYALVEKTTSDTEYTVFQVQPVQGGAAPGDWYHVRWPGSEVTGWLWSELMTGCTSIPIAAVGR
jgi:murein DD-endopeptidase MepM/ murein hydrolase activator NlpD